MQVRSVQKIKPYSDLDYLSGLLEYVRGSARPRGFRSRDPDVLACPVFWSMLPRRSGSSPGERAQTRSGPCRGFDPMSRLRSIPSRKLTAHTRRRARTLVAAGRRCAVCMARAIPVPQLQSPARTGKFGSPSQENANLSKMQSPNAKLLDSCF